MEKEKQIWQLFPLKNEIPTIESEHHFEDISATENF